jgi:hypothetical protein
VALATIEVLRPTAVLAGHKREDWDDDPRKIDETRE